jgi:DNA-binding NtrC family response regulator
VAPRLLIADDEDDGREVLLEMAADWGMETRAARDGAEALRVALAWHPDAVLSDLMMPGTDGMWLLSALRREGVAAPVVLLTGRGSVPLAVHAIQDGAYDFIEKPVEGARLRLVLDRALAKGAADREVELLRHRLAAVAPGADFLGTSPQVRSLVDLAHRVADAAASVVIQGPSGTGKEVLARVIHAASPRREGPFVAVNCAAIPAGLLESELFGHERGAFTGARDRRPGLVELASGGTLFLDEVAEIPLELQAKFLRVLEDRRVRRLGGSAEITVDARVVVATLVDLREAVRAGRFREDLFFRLAVFTLEVPPLAERGEDVPLLAQHFAARFARETGKPLRGFSPGALRRLQAHAWPGNVRELRNVVERATILADGPLIHEGHLPPELGAGDPGEGSLRLPLGRSLDEVERAYLVATLRRNRGNRARTASALGISEKTLYNKLRAYAGDDRDGEGGAGGAGGAG